MFEDLYSLIPSLLELRSTEMSSQPHKDHGNSITNRDIDNRYVLSNNQRFSLNSGRDPICQTNMTPARFILARKIPFYTQSVHDSSYRQLQHRIWCLIKTEKDEYRYELLSECQRNKKAGKVTYHDMDWGKGLHPSADQAWLHELRSKGAWSDNVYDVIAKVRLGRKNHYTVILSVKGEGKSILEKVRKDCNYVSDDLVRLSLSTFRRARNG
jgi:hypothetical protein